MRDLEVELTFPLLNPEALTAFLKDRATAERSDLSQKDTYYTPAHRNFIAAKPISDWLRIRETPNGASVTFKHWHNKEDPESVVADEYETSIGDADALHAVFRALDMQPIVTVEKHRSTWVYRGVEIAVDHVTDLGWYIELEAKGDFPSVDAATKHLYAVLTELQADVGPQDFKGYPHRLLEQSGKL
ncbi:MAG: class IV adenylate cyclase [Candidatus Kerfeldbacteria bacterium]|nr:class IV adenylate cyclase [Candidatus Kerfeldbacteria bacterium]